MLGLKRVYAVDTGELDDSLVDTRIMLHRARTKRIESGIDAEIALREPSIVTDKFGLAGTWPAR